MLKITNKKSNIYFYIFLFILLTTFNNFKVSKKFKTFFEIKTLSVYGINENLTNKIYDDLSFLLDQNLLFIDKKKILNVIKSNDYIENYVVLKKYPSELEVYANHTELLGQTFIEGEKYYLGFNGKLIDHKIYLESKNLPNIYGSFKIEDFINLIKWMKNNDINTEQFSDFYFFRSKRWDIKSKNNTLIKLPSSNLDPISDYIKNFLEDKKYKKKIIDLRVPNQVIINNG